MFQNIRMSKHFVMLDFMQDLEVYSSRICLTADELSEDALTAGRGLCERLLEPMITRFGPVSISSGYRPEAVLQRLGFQTPHRWGSPSGGAAAADVVLHDWVNANRPPIHAAVLWLNEDRVFNRFITYAGSEFICASVVPSGYNRHALYENKLVRDQYKAHHITWTNRKADRADLPSPFPARRDWRREPGAGPQAYKQVLQAQHVRVGRYFTFLDFCRTERGLAEGFRWVPTVTAARKQIEYARMAAEILDPLVMGVGRVSVVKGLMPRSLALEEADPWHHRWVDGNAVVEFLLPQGVGSEYYQYLTHSSIVDFGDETHASDTIKVTVEWSPFEPAFMWSSAKAARRAPRVRTRQDA